MGLLDFIASPSRSDAINRAEEARRRMAQRAELRSRREEAMVRVLEAESAALVAESLAAQARIPTVESTTNLGNPFWMQYAGISVDEAWKRGLPGGEWTYGLSADDVAGDDALRSMVRAQARVLYDQHPHAKGLVEGAVAFLVGSMGWQVQPTPRWPAPAEGKVIGVAESVDDPSRIDPVGAAVATVSERPSPRPAYLRDRGPLDKSPIDWRRATAMRDAWTSFVRRGRFHPRLGDRGFWAEAVRRKLRDGEVFVYLGNERSDGRLAPRFIEPECIVAPNGTPHISLQDRRNRARAHPDSNGVRVDPNDPARVLGYWYSPEDGKEPELIPAERMLVHLHGVDSNTRRGVPSLWVVRNFLTHLDGWIQQSLRNQRIQSMVAIVRSWANTTRAAVQGLISSKTTRSLDRATQSGNSLTQQSLATLPIVDAPAGMQQQMQSPNGNFGDSEILVRRVLLAIAVGVNQSEAMVAGDGSNANYASTRITQLIPLRSFEAEQGDWAETVRQFYERWAHTEAAMGRVPRIEADSHLDCNVTPSALPNFEAEVAAPTASSLAQAGIVSRRTAQEMVRIDPEIEKDRMAEEEREAQRQDDDTLDSLFDRGVAQDDAPGFGENIDQHTDEDGVIDLNSLMGGLRNGSPANGNGAVAGVAQ